ncbi:hypothetical protein H2198_003336 [Neophaeococcomyces mojaviensis]|uniref:Uncharacterized protein n=1 Tax=Neophaeococcomyces mojaviensis TaxID=3383035 RepID=A0ACC3ABK6_9EURO|nr:hypothetical protein H2198_003336 [Knufia sp. JES_112]
MAVSRDIAGALESCSRETERTPLLADYEHDQNLQRAQISSTFRHEETEAAQVGLDQKSHLLPNNPTWRAESWLLLSYAAPLIGTYLLQYFYSVVTIFVAGHINSEALAAASIGVFTMNIIGFSVFEGMATALDTLCAQAYGSGNIKGVGIHVQRMLLCMGIVAVPIAAFWICSPWILSLFVKQTYLAVRAGQFLHVSLIGVPGYASFEALKRFSQAQGDFTSSLVVLIICAPVNVFLNWLFVFKFGWGLEGTALASALTNDLRPILMLAYLLIFNRWTLQCWGGFDKAALQKWGPMISLSTAGAILNLSEWFAFEVLTFSSSYISTTHIAAQTILSTVSILVWHIPFSVSVAVSTRIGHLVGSGALKNVRRVIPFYAAVFIVVGIFDGTVVFALRKQIAKLFSEDPAVQEIATRTIPLVAIFQLIDAILAGTSGVLRGFGRQSFAAWASFLVNYFAAVPLALWLELGSPGLGLVGCWTALQGGMIIVSTLEVGAIKFMSWKKCVEDAQSRD